MRGIQEVEVGAEGGDDSATTAQQPSRWVERLLSYRVTRDKTENAILFAAIALCVAFSASATSLFLCVRNPGGHLTVGRYPGIACDVESYAYMPLLQETGHVLGCPRKYCDRASLSP